MHGIYWQNSHVDAIEGRNFKSDGMEGSGTYLGHIMELIVIIFVHSP
jgi:hypothetical protein